VGRKRVLKGDERRMTTNLEIVQQAYAAFGKGDLPGILAALDPNIVWENPGPNSPAYFGAHRGHAAVATNIFGFLSENLQFEVFEPREFLVGGDKVVALLHIEAKITRTGERLVQEAVHVFSFQGGKVVQFQDFQNSYALATALTA
jgi:ketosteroid isomerase-like protein